MSCGRPVVAFGGGGALDTVVPGVTGELFVEASGESLAAALAAFDWTAYDPRDCRAQAERFSAASFRRELATYLARVAAPQSVTPLVVCQTSSNSAGTWACRRSARGRAH